MKNPYHVLEIAKDADEKTIKEAYRRLARKYHPDVNPGKPEAEERFKDIQSAYDLLSDQGKRDAYDRLGDRAFTAGAGFGGSERDRGRSTGMPSFEDIFGPGSLQDILRSILSHGFAPGGAGTPPSSDLQGDLSITFEEAFQGTEKALATVGQAPVRVRIPAGIEDGTLLRVPGKGRRGTSKPGDLYLRVRVLADPRFERQGADLYVELALGLAEAALGAEIAIATPGGETRVRVPAGTPSGRLLRLTGRGFRRPDGSHGDLYARVRILPPPDPSPAERRALEEFARASSFNPRDPA